MKITENLKLTSSIEDGRQEPGKPLHSFGKLGFEYISSLVNTSGEIDVVNGPSLQSAVLFHHGPFRAGAELLFNSHLEEKDQSSEIVDFNVGFSFEGSDSHTSVTTTDMLGNIRMAYVHHVSPVLDCVGQVDYRLKTNYQRICLGVKWRWERNTSKRTLTCYVYACICMLYACMDVYMIGRVRENIVNHALINLILALAAELRINSKLLIYMFFCIFVCASVCQH